MNKNNTRGYFGTSDKLLPLIPVKAGSLSLQVENGQARYITWNGRELIRMIYPAARDALWLNIPWQASEDKLIERSHGFEFNQRRIYTTTSEPEANSLSDNSSIPLLDAYLRINGGKNNSITIQFQAKVLHPFKRNRIGLCVLLPLKECVGIPCEVTDNIGNHHENRFPMSISPHQPFLNMQALSWSLTPTESLRIQFEGDIFEMEDQRNWSDASFKIYSTPLSLPSPVDVEVGQIIEQNIRIEVVESSHLHPKILSSEFLNETEITPHAAVIQNPPFEGAKKLIQISQGKQYPTAKLGLCHSIDTVKSNAQPDRFLESDTILLRDLQLDHLRIDYFVDIDKIEDIQKKIDFYISIDSKVELALQLNKNEFDFNCLAQLKTFTDSQRNAILSLILVQKGKAFSELNLFWKLIDSLKELFPQSKIGFGTDGHFVDVNRSSQNYSGLDFISFPIVPQVHATDTRTLIENLASQRDCLVSAHALYPDTAIYVSPITLKERFRRGGKSSDPSQLPTLNDADLRQQALFTAAWFILSLKYLAPAVSLSYFETLGPRGIIDTAVSPTYLLFQELAYQNPEWIEDFNSTIPLSVDGVGFVGKNQKRFCVMVNFSTEIQTISFSENSSDFSFPYREIKVLCSENVDAYLNQPKSFLTSWLKINYADRALILPAESLTFLQS